MTSRHLKSGAYEATGASHDVCQPRTLHCCNYPRKLQPSQHPHNLHKHSNTSVTSRAIRVIRIADAHNCTDVVYLHIHRYQSHTNPRKHANCINKGTVKDWAHALRVLAPLQDPPPPA